MLPLVYFSHAELKDSDNLNVSFDDYQEVTKSEGLTLNTKKNKLKLILSDEAMNYEGIEENESPYAIGVLDKSSGEINVINTSFFVMKPECYLKQETKVDTDKVEVKFTDKLNSLTEAFGSSKKRKAMHTKIKNKLDSETLDEAVGAAVKEAKLKNEDEAQDEDQQQNGEDGGGALEDYSIIPKPNKDAKKPFDVYNIDEIIINKVDLEIYTGDLSTKFISTNTEMILNWKKSQFYPEYVCERLLMVQSSKVHQHKVKKCKLLAYINFLIKLYQLKSAQIRSKAPLKTLEIPDALARVLLDTYTCVSASNASSRSTRTMPRRLRDKLICHIMILALYIDDFSSDLQSLQKDLKVATQKLSEYYYALGCHIKNHITTINSKKTVSKLAVLSLPLLDISKIQSKKRARKT